MAELYAENAFLTHWLLGDLNKILVIYGSDWVSSSQRKVREIPDPAIVWESYHRSGKNQIFAQSRGIVREKFLLGKSFEIKMMWKLVNRLNHKAIQWIALLRNQ